MIVIFHFGVLKWGTFHMYRQIEFWRKKTLGTLNKILLEVNYGVPLKNNKI